MKYLTFSALFAASALSAPSTPEKRQDTTVLDSTRDLSVTAIDWQRSGNKIDGIRFQASIVGTSLSWRCTSDASGDTTAGFAPLKTDRCAKGAPITFAYDTSGSGPQLRLWYSELNTKSFNGSAPVTPGNTTPFTVKLAELQAVPKTTLTIVDNA